MALIARFLTLLLILSPIAFSGEGAARAEGDAAHPHHYGDAIEKEFGEPHAFGQGHSIVVHEVLPEYQGTITDFDGGEEQREGTVARVDVCAGEDTLSLSPAAIRRFRVTRVGGETALGTEHVYAMSDRAGLRAPLFEFGSLEAGECQRGWLDFLKLDWADGDYEVLSMAIAFSEAGAWAEDARSAEAVWHVPLK